MVLKHVIPSHRARNPPQLFWQDMASGIPRSLGMTDMVTLPQICHFEPSDEESPATLLTRRGPMDPSVPRDDRKRDDTPYMSFPYVLSGNPLRPQPGAVCRFCKLPNRTRFSFDRHSRTPLAGIHGSEQWTPAVVYPCVGRGSNDKL